MTGLELLNKLKELDEEQLNRPVIAISELSFYVQDLAIAKESLYYDEDNEECLFEKDYSKEDFKDILEDPSVNLVVSEGDILIIG